MACPVCPAAGWAGGWIGGYFGINTPQHPGGELFSALITANLISITVIALKSLLGISLCKGGTFTFENIGRVGIITMPLGILYSIGVNFILNNYVFPAEDPTCETSPEEEILNAEEEVPPCCCKKKAET